MLIAFCQFPSTIDYSILPAFLTQRHLKKLPANQSVQATKPHDPVYSDVSLMNVKVLLSLRCRFIFVNNERG